MAKINSRFVSQVKSPVLLAGLFSLSLLISGCEPPKTPEQVTTAFWGALIQGDIEIARKFATEKSKHLITESETRKNAKLSTGQIVIDGDHANVATVITQDKKVSAFNTALVKESNLWLVDYQQTLINISAIPFNGIFNSLDQLSETFKKQLEQQMPLFEKQIESFGEELKQQLDEFGRYLENPKKWKKQHPYRDDSI